MKKLLSLFLIVGFIALLIGCHAGGHAPFVNIADNGIVIPPTTVNNLGQFDAPITLPSGAKIKTTENGTLPAGSTVQVAETKKTISSPDGTNQEVYIYTIDARDVAV